MNDDFPAEEQEMSEGGATREPSASESLPRYDVIVIGAGVGGLYQLHRLRHLGLSIRVFEAGNGIGGTWYWNCYPGARLDTESYSYAYSFSPELLDDWEWSEHFVSQPELLRYYEHVADRFDLRRDIELGARVASATFDESADEWEISIEDGRRARGRFLVTGAGPLSAPTWPRIPGRESFAGEAHHTARWPREGVRLDGQRVGVIGTGASGVQVIQESAKVAAHLTVFQRRPHWCLPLRNKPIQPSEQPALKARYPEIFRRCKETLGAMLHDPDPRSMFDCAPEEREAFWEEQYQSGGFALWLGNFHDLLTDEKANALASEFVARKIRERVDDPAIAERLIPKDQGFGVRRVPLETDYYEVYNQDNVELVDVLRNPIERITATGVVVAGDEIPLDVLVFATGFDAITGALDRIDIRGLGGQRLAEKWAEGPRTYLGFTSAGFPNLLTLVGPQNGSTFCNMPRCIEQNVDFVTELIAFMTTRGHRRFEATEEAEASWTAYVEELAAGSLLTKTDSWFTGVNVNLPDRAPRILQYMGGAPTFRAECDQVASRGYEGFEIS